MKLKAVQLLKHLTLNFNDELYHHNKDALYQLTTQLQNNTPDQQHINQYILIVICSLIDKIKRIDSALFQLMLSPLYHTHNIMSILGLDLLNRLIYYMDSF